jgi:uncharacterized membrane protein
MHKQTALCVNEESSHVTLIQPVFFFLFFLYSMLCVMMFFSSLLQLQIESENKEITKTFQSFGVDL